MTLDVELMSFYCARFPDWFGGLGPVILYFKISDPIGPYIRKSWTSRSIACLRSTFDLLICIFVRHVQQESYTTARTQAWRGPPGVCGVQKMLIRKAGMYIIANKNRGICEVSSFPAAQFFTLYGDLNVLIIAVPHLRRQQYTDKR